MTKVARKNFNFAVTAETAAAIEEASARFGVSKTRIIVSIVEKFATKIEPEHIIHPTLGRQSSVVGFDEIKERHGLSPQQVVALETLGIITRVATGKYNRPMFLERDIIKAKRKVPQGRKHTETILAM